MSRCWISFLLATLSITPLGAQSGTGTQDLRMQVSPAQPWTDTGLDLQTGDMIKITASAASTAPSSCQPAGAAGSAANSGRLPLPTAPAGALIARPPGEGSVPVLVGGGRELSGEEPSHLFLGMNFPGTPACQGVIAVEIHKTANTASGEAGQPKSRGQELKSQLANAAQVFMQGQFGVGKTESAAANAETATSSPAPEGVKTSSSLTVSDTPLDADLRKHLDSLPRRVNDQLNNLGDMVNFVIIGSQKDVQAALEAAAWHVADTSNTLAAINA